MITLQMVAERVIDKTGIDIMSKGRRRVAVEARALFAELAVMYCDVPFLRISDFLDMEHASILHYRNNDYFSKYNDYLYKLDRAVLIREFKEKAALIKKSNAENSVNIVEDAIYKLNAVLKTLQEQRKRLLELEALKNE